MYTCIFTFNICQICIHVYYTLTCIFTFNICQICILYTTLFIFPLVIQSCELEFVFERGHHKVGGPLPLHLQKKKLMDVISKQYCEYYYQWCEQSRVCMFTCCHNNPNFSVCCTSLLVCEGYIPQDMTECCLQMKSL